MHGLTVQPAWESASTQALVQAVGKGLGISLLPHCLLLYRAAETQSCFPFSNVFSFPCSPASVEWTWTNFVRFCSTTVM